MSEQPVDQLSNDSSAEPLPAAIAPTPDDSPRILTLVAHDRREPPRHFPEHHAQGDWAAISAPWHPAILNQLRHLPRVVPATHPDPPESHHLYIVSESARDLVPSGMATQWADSGARRIDAGLDRAALVEVILERFGLPATAATGNPRLARDFHALGLARWWLRDLAAAMNHDDGVDPTLLGREVLAGAAAWSAGDDATAANRLRAAFELLTQARERFYPVDAYLVDLCLVDPNTPPGDWDDPLAAEAPVSFVAPAAAIEQLAAASPESIARLRQAVDDGWADVVGGTYLETDEALRPIGSILWQYHRGAAVYRSHIDDRTVETLARRRFALYPVLPQIARRFGIRYAVHLALDGSRFPVPAETKRLWNAPDGSYLEALTRPPLPADRWANGASLAWRIGKSMKEDHVATVALAHWPGRHAGWFEDLRRIAAYSPVHLRWTTLADYFHLTDRPYESLKPRLDDYETPYLAQAVARNDPEPITRRVERARLRAGLESASTVLAALVLTGGSCQASQREALASAEDDLELGRLEQAAEGIESLQAAIAATLGEHLTRDAAGGTPGTLAVNVCPFPRRAAVMLGERTDAPAVLLTQEAGDSGAVALVDLPALGYAWLPTNPEAEPPVSPFLQPARAEENRLETGLLVVEVDPKTGGLRSIRAPGEAAPRLAQQIVLSGLYDRNGERAWTTMQCDRVSIEESGPARARIETTGTLLDPSGGHSVAAFRQAFTVHAGLPSLEIEIELTLTDQSWIAHAAYGDPWDHAAAVRWAWADAGSLLRRTGQLCPEDTTARRPETPDAVEIHHRRGKSTLVFRGLAHHQRHGQRMLDTLLIAGGETARTFRLRVDLDREHPYQPVMEAGMPPILVPTASGPPPRGATSSLVHIDRAGVAVVHLGVPILERPPEASAQEEVAEPVAPPDRICLHLLETTGSAARCRIRLARAPARAVQVDFQDEPVMELETEEHAVLIDLTPHELARVIVEFDGA